MTREERLAAIRHMAQSRLVVTAPPLTTQQRLRIEALTRPFDAVAAA